jgi:hypothetical protein
MRALGLGECEHALIREFGRILPRILVEQLAVLILEASR